MITFRKPRHGGDVPIQQQSAALCHLEEAPPRAPEESYTGCRSPDSAERPGGGSQASREVTEPVPQNRNSVGDTRRAAREPPFPNAECDRESGTVVRTPVVPAPSAGRLLTLRKLPALAAPPASNARPFTEEDTASSQAQSPGARSTNTQPASKRALRKMVQDHMDFVWRSLRRLGVREADCEDGCQRVWLVLARRLDDVIPGKERSFIFSVVIRIASEMRRREAQYNHWQELGDIEHLAVSRAADPAKLYEAKLARQMLDRLLEPMSWELRTAFVMFELEGFSSTEIARVLGVSRGTIASRLRLARAAFERGAQRLRETGLRDSSPSGVREALPSSPSRTGAELHGVPRERNRD